MTTRFSRYILLCLSVLAFCGPARAAFAQTYTESVLHNFCSIDSGYCADGENPEAGLVQGTDGNFYGTMELGGNSSNSGTVIKITPSGALTTLYSFCSQTDCIDGDAPKAALMQDTDGNFYGTTSGGGNSNSGTVFKITPSGMLTTLYSFCTETNCADGDGPYAGLVRGTDGNFYGTTVLGGNSTNNGSGSGTIFKITLSGALTTLYTFCSQTGCKDGATPFAGLVQGTDGNFYGTTMAGGNSFNGGIVFKLTPAGILTTLYSFCTRYSSVCTDGSLPQTALIQGTDGNFYGTTETGGNGLIAGRLVNAGTVFKITTAGVLTTLYKFCSQTGCTDGNVPDASLVQGTDGNFYGTTAAGGNSSNNGNVSGTAFKITPAGALTNLYNFCSLANCADGAMPQAGLVQGTDGNFYGTTTEGGLDETSANGDGIVFKITVVPPATTSTFTATPNPVTVGQTATLKATVASTNGTPTGTIAFSLNGSTFDSCTLASGSCSISASTNGLAPGTYPVVATYTGSASYSGSVSTALDVALNAAPTLTTLTAGTNPVTPPARDTLTARVTRSASGAAGTPTGTVKFYAGTAVLGSGPLNGSGVATFTASTSGVAAGNYAVTATYNGDANDTASTSSPVSVVAQ